MEKNIYLFAGCNGSGKTTAAKTLLKSILKCEVFINADEIAKELSPINPEIVSIDAGRIMLEQIKDLIKKNKSFAFETTLATKIFKQKLEVAKESGYTITLLFFWLNDIALAKNRVKYRVQEGGHFIPEHVIERRYIRGVKYLFDIYLPIVDEFVIFDNTEFDPEIIAFKYKFESIEIKNYSKWLLLNKIL